MPTTLPSNCALNAINHFIAEHYPRRIDITEVADLSHLTKAAFCRFFKRITHLTFTQYLNQYRVNQAQKLLLLDHTVSEASFACGFESLSYFNINLPPGDRRKYIAV